ncbi:uncharacterized protein [Leptinotarsa decemlineata]|uniref:uncharacterized protein n=1 Tax=Leptinotarsa decemlineata TaxID=7539 RepID=UPI003D307988
MEKRTSKREGAGLNQSLSSDYVWPNGFGSREKPESSLDKLPEKVVEDKSGESTSLIHEVHSKQSVHSRASRDTGLSRRSSLNLKKKRIALKIERQRRELLRKSRELELEEQQLEEKNRRELKKKEIADSLHLLQLEEELHEAEIDAQEEGSSYVQSEARSENIRRELVEEQEQRNRVSQWVDYTSEQFHYDRQENLSRIPEKTEKPNDDIPKVEGQFSEEKPGNITSQDIQQLCGTVANVLRTFSLPASTTQNPTSLEVMNPDKFHMRKMLEKDFPQFDGSPQDWPLFHKSFKNLRKFCDYSNEEIMLKLQRFLKGEAKTTVAAMILTADNVDLVIETLEKRFGRPEYIIDILMNRISILPSIRENNFEKLIHYSAEVSNMVSIMKSLGSKRYLENPQFIRELLTKIPDSMKLSWGEKLEMKKGDINLEDFSLWLNEKASFACNVSTPRNETFSQKFTNQMKRNERVYNIHTQNTHKTCGYCDKIHQESICPQMNHDDLNKRWEMVTGKKLCFSCLQKNHQKFKCKKRKICGTNCKLHHHPLLHKELEVNSNQAAIGRDTNDDNRGRVCSVNKPFTTILLRVIRIKLYGPRGIVPILALCDEASTVTLLDAEVAETLGLTGTKESLCLQWTNENVMVEENSVRLDVTVSKIDDSRMFTMKRVRTVTHMSLPEQHINISDWKKFSHLKGVPIKYIDHEKPSLLIGQDNIHLILARQIRTGPENLPVASKCKLGWAVHGPSPNSGENSFKAHTLHICEKETTDEELQKMVEKSYLTETFSTLIAADQPSCESSRALELMRNTLKYTGENYEIGLLWKTDNIQLPEKNPNKPNKIRLVFDAAAKSRGMSLNDALLSGPDMLQSLVAILWKFRQRRFGFCGDIREMFHRVGIQERDRCAQRFLWRNLESDRPPDIYEMLVMTFGATFSPVCAQFVKNLNAEEFSTNPDIRTAIIKKFYVDDYLDSKDTEEEALETIIEVCKVQKVAGFEVVNWMTNSQLIRDKLSDDMLLAATKNIDDTSLHRILGLWWDPRNDEFSFRLTSENLVAEQPTKRKVLQALMSVYDPLGLISIFTVRGKILMQDIWRIGIDWDYLLPEELLIAWKDWLSDMEKIVLIKIPRCYSLLIPSALRIEIHTFCDSSEKAFSAVSFLRVIGENRTDVCLISAKTRVSPLKPLSIPRLELQAAVMASRLAQVIRNELEFPIDIRRFSKWNRLIRTTGWCLRFFEIVRNKEKFPPNLTVEEILKAEKIWLKHVQQECFPEEIQKLKTGKSLSGQSKLACLFPEMKDGIMVLSGRTNFTEFMAKSTRQPIILSPKHEFTKLLIQNCQEKFHHRGVELVINEIRQKYWVINCRAAVKSAFSSCLKCRIEKSKPSPPLMGQLPEARLKRGVRAFINTGMDYFGPIMVKIGRRCEKRWGVLFTCLAVRAIHLEIAHSLSSDSTIQAILRMSARRGQPQVIFCDNGTNLRGAAHEIRQAMEEIDRTTIIDSLSSRGISFQFIPPSAPHMEGIWERLIGSVKSVIGKVLYDSSLKEETLQTFFAEAEKIVNSRPLTKVSMDSADAEALTPNHFLIGSSNGEGDLVPINPDANTLRREWKISRMLINSFWTGQENICQLCRSEVNGLQTHSTQ